MVEERDGPHKEVRFRLEVGVEDHDVVALLRVVVLEPLLERPRLVAVPVVPDLVPYVNPFARPALTLLLHQPLVSTTSHPFLS